MGIHTGECIARGGDHYGRAVNKAARLEQAAYGGQVLLSEPTAALVRTELDDDLSLAYLGEHHFDGILDPAGVYQLSIAGLPNDYPPLRTRDIGLERLPLELTPLIGRADVTTQLADELRRGRVVSLVGPPGVGKSRLAIRVASEEGRIRDTGVRFIDLTTCRQVEATDGAIANALGVRPEDEVSYAEGIVRALRLNDTLIVLDNCEHLLPAIQALVEVIVSSCPKITILATSRERLDLPYELVWPVHTLAIPPRDASSVAEIEAAESVQLLVERARAASAHFTLSDEEAPAIAAICRRCDGLPLALQLAAARLGTLSPRELLAALETSMDVLGADADRPSMGRTVGLREALDTSYATLPDDERELFDQLAVFAGFASTDSIAAVCGMSPREARRLLDGLVRRSLVAVRTEGGWTRFGQLESIRQYAQQHGRVDDDLEARHAIYFGEEAVRRGRQYLTADAPAAARALAEHFDDFRLAVQRLRDRQLWPRAVDIVLSLHEFCLYSMRPELHSWAQELDGQLPVTDRRCAELKGVIALGSWFKGNHQGALAKGTEALEAAEHVDGPVSTIWARTSLLNAWGHIGDLDKAAEHLFALRKECLATGNPYWIINAHVTEAIGLSTIGLHELALNPAAEAVRAADDFGNPDALYWALLAQAMAMRPSDLAGAEAALDRALAATRVMGSRWNEGLVMNERLGVLVEQGRTVPAAATALDLLIHLEAAGLFGRIWLAVVWAGQALADADKDEIAALLLAAMRARPVVPEARIVTLMDELEATLRGRLGHETMTQLANRARFLSDAQVLEQCREALEGLLRA
jgi:predicted ATPase